MTPAGFVLDQTVEDFAFAFGESDEIVDHQRLREQDQMERQFVVCMKALEKVEKQAYYSQFHINLSS